MAKERSRSTSCLKKIRNTPENVITVETSLSSGKILNKSDSSTTCSSRKSSNHLLRRCSEQSVLKSDTASLKKNTSVSGKSRENESQRQASQVSQSSRTSSQGEEPEIGMKTVCECLTELEHCLLKKASFKRGKKKQSLSGIQDEHHRIDLIEHTPIASADPIQGNDRDPCGILTKSNNSLDNGLVSDNPAKEALPSNNLITPSKESSRGSSTFNREQILKVVDDSSIPRSKSVSSRKVLSKDSSNSNQAFKGSADVASQEHNRQVLQEVSSNDSTGIEKTLKTPVELPLSRTSSRASQNRSRNNSVNDERPEKTSANRISSSRTSRSSMEESAKRRNKPVERNASKTSANKTRSRSESINRSETNNLQTEPTREQTAANDPPAESANILPNDQNTNSNGPSNNAEPALANIANPLPNNGGESVTIPPDVNQANPIANAENDDRYTSPSERQPNPEGNIQQSLPETRTQPIPADPNSSDAIRHDLEAWLQNTAKRSDTEYRSRKPSGARPYIKFPAIRPCDKDITSDPEDCKRKLEQKLNRVYKLKQAYYSDPQDNIPFIDLAYTKEGIFVDEPIERAFIYNEEILKMNANSRNSSRASSLPRSNQSESVLFSPLRLNMRYDKGATVFSNKHLNKESSHSKWMEKILEETETNNMGNIMHEFQRKLDTLANNIRRIPLSSETSSVISEPVYRSQRKFIIPNRSSRLDK